MVNREYEPGSIQKESQMTPEYRATLLKLLADQAKAELFASHTYSKWVRRAPGPEEKVHLADIAREETEHWYGTVKLLQGLGVSHDDAPKYESRQWFYNLVHLFIPRYKWLDILMMTFLIDRGAFLLVEDFTQSSYAPWAKFCRAVLDEEVGHVDFGNNFVKSQVERYGAAAVQRALNKWWRVALNMFGPPRTEHTDLYIRLGLKYRSNEERRQLFRRDCERQIVTVGLKVPKLYRESFPFF